MNDNILCAIESLCDDIATNTKAEDNQKRANAILALAFAGKFTPEESEEDYTEDDSAAGAEEDKTKIREQVDAVKKALEGTDSEQIKKAMEDLTEAVYAVTTKIYQKVQQEQAAQQQAAGATGGNEGSGSPDDNVVDAEVKEVKKG